MRAQTMTSCRIQVVSLMLAGLISIPAHAEVIPGRWERVTTLKLGTPITVALKNGDQVDGEFEGLSASAVDLETHSARAVIPKADIQTIATRKRGGVGAGAKKGALVGAAVGLGLTVVTFATTGISDRHKKDAALVSLISMGLSTALGAGLGAAARTGTETAAIVVYKAPRDPSESVN